MKKGMIGIGILVLMLTGCATTETTCHKNYELSNVMEATVGSPLISKGCETLTFIICIWGERCTEGNKAVARVNPSNVQSFNSELLYGGVANDVIKIVYREYSNNYARPAFSQEVQYDLKKSNIIVFRNTKVEVISASNDKLVYKVLESPTSF